MTRVYFVRHAQPEHDWEEEILFHEWKDCSYAICKKIKKR